MLRTREILGSILTVWTLLDFLNYFIIALFATCAHLGTFLPRACTTSGATRTSRPGRPGVFFRFLASFLPRPGIMSVASMIVVLEMGDRSACILTH